MGNKMNYKEEKW